MNILDQMRQDGDALQRVRSEHQLSIRALSLLADAWGFHIPFPKNDPEYGFQWFNQQYSFKLTLATSRIEVNAAVLLKTFKKAKLWKAYIEMLEEYDFQPIGLITPAMGTKLWIIHNWWQLLPTEGYPRVEWVATTKDTGTLFEPLESFAKSVAAVGLAP